MKRAIPFFLICTLLFTGCNDTVNSSSDIPSEIIVSSVPVETVESSAFPVEVCGVSLEASPKRVVSLSPAVTEIIAELDYTARLRGISNYCDYPELSLQTVGSSENPDVEIIKGLSPDVVFTLSGLSERDIYTVEAEGAKVMCLVPPTSIEEYGKLYGDIAAVFGGAEKGNAASEAAVKHLTDAAGAVSLGSFVYVTDKLTAAGAGTFENAVLSLSGDNICTEEGYISMLTLSESTPDHIIASDRLSYDELRSDEALSAMISGGAEIIYVSASVFERPSARTANVFSQIAEQLSDDTSETE